MSKKIIWAIVPARGSSKSIPNKNLALLAGKPLINYVISAAKQASNIDQIICTTDSQQISSHCESLEISTHKRPAKLATDDSPVRDAVVDLITNSKNKFGPTPDIFLLLQPTSPLVLPEHIEASIQALQDHPEFPSVQTVCEIPHNMHAYNQREIRDGGIRFAFPEDRKRCYNRQLKPKFYQFGNLFAIRTKAFLDGTGFAPEPSFPIIIDRKHSIDIDQVEDIKIAEQFLF